MKRLHESPLSLRCLSESEMSDLDSQSLSRRVTHADIDMWEKFDALQPVPGLLKNVLVITPNENQVSSESQSEWMSVNYRDQVEFAYEISRYLFDNGLTRVSLTTTGEVADMMQMYDTRNFPPDLNVQRREVTRLEGNVDVAIMIVQASGVYHQSLLHKSVEDAFLAAKRGVILIASEACLRGFRNPWWKDFIEYLRDRKLVNNHLEIFCARHGVQQNVCNRADLKSMSPHGGCTGFCGEMACGHLCPSVCHPLDNTWSALRCRQPCSRVCRGGHQCSNQCWEPCGKCYHVISVSYECEHASVSQKQIFCHEELKVRCAVPVKKGLPCGHLVSVGCGVTPTYRPCQQNMHAVLACGHQHTFKCSEWEQLSTTRCQVLVTKTLKCGHTQELKCFESGTREPPLICTSRCNKALRCGHVCQLPCHLEDPDHRSTLRCRELCQKYCLRNVHMCASRHPCSESCPPCRKKFEFRLVCMHTVQIVCSSPDPNENSYICKMPCGKKHQFCNHACMKSCGQDCGVCEHPVAKPITTCKFKPAHTKVVKCQERASQICDIKVNAADPGSCGHTVQVPCFQAESMSPVELARRCHSKCSHPSFDKEGECGHFCRGQCLECYQGRLHVRCKEPCGRMLTCGHSCMSPCNMVCPPCRLPCYNSCVHKRCPLECGVPCVWKCEEPCSYACQHSMCTNQCSEVCNKMECYEPCDKLLSCGHTCVGFCGEPCPKFCRFCNPDELAKGIFLGRIEVSDNERFILLEDCGHCIENECLEQWLRVQSESAEIVPFRCPICRTPIHWIHRYSEMMHEMRRMINMVRTKVFGDFQEIDTILQGIRDTIQSEVKRYKKLKGTKYARLIMQKVDGPRLISPHSEFTSTSIGMARFLRWYCGEWTAMNDLLQNHIQDIPFPIFDRYCGSWECYMEMAVYNRQWPLHPNEMLGLERERARLNDAFLLYTRLSPSLFALAHRLASSWEAKKAFGNAEQILLHPVPYNSQRQRVFYGKLRDLDNVVNSTLEISEPERRQIVLAFGQRTGRWFKCKNGHVYVITECGGAEELSRCNECGAVIGGESHRLAPENYLASEMDGAIEPLYPTVLDRPDV